MTATTPGRCRCGADRGHLCGVADHAVRAVLVCIAFCVSCTSLCVTKLPLQLPLLTGKGAPGNTMIFLGMLVRSVPYIGLSVASLLFPS